MTSFSILPSQPQSCYDAGCPQAGKAKGFALPSGNIDAKIALLLETPAVEEINYVLKEDTSRSGYPWDVPDVRTELEYRHALYPTLASDYIGRGAPVVGRSGMELFSWALRAAGITRRDVYLTNVLQCYPGKNDKGEVAYPTKDARKLAESCCARLWWRLEEFRPEFSIINFHPAAIVRSVIPLRLQIAAFVRAKKIANDGHKVVVCCGSKAAEAWFGYGSNVSRWVGHTQQETDFTRMLRARRLATETIAPTLSTR